LPVEQPRRKRGNEIAAAGPNRRMTLPKPPHPAIFKDAFGGAKIGEFCSSTFEFLVFGGWKSSPEAFVENHSKVLLKNFSNVLSESSDRVIFSSGLFVYLNAEVCVWQ
jgi:hypothetical protein